MSSESLPRQKSAPSDGIVFEATVRALSPLGAGVVDFQNRSYFVEGVWPGDLVRAEVLSQREVKAYGTARLLEIIEPSVERRPSPCAHHGLGPQDCHGCPWIFANYPAQFQAKVERVRYALDRQGIVASNWILKPADEEFHYRNRAQVKFDGRDVGFVNADRGKRVVPIESCAVMTPELQRQFARLKSDLRKLSDSSGSDPQFQIPRGQPWVFFDLDDTAENAEFVPNQKAAFRQANDAQNRALQELVTEFLSRSPDRQSEAARAPVLELFAGDGNLSFPVWKSNPTRPLWAYEGSPEAAQRFERRFETKLQQDPSQAPTSSARNATPSFWIRDLYKQSVFQQLIEPEHLQSATALLLDPPRSGFPRLGELASQMPLLDTIVLVSCSLREMVRDVAAVLGQAQFNQAQFNQAHFNQGNSRLPKSPWQLQSLAVIDMMPQTPHIETVAFLRRGIRCENLK